MIILLPGTRQAVQETLIRRRHLDWADDVMRMSDINLIEELGRALAVDLCQADDFDPSDGDARMRSNAAKSLAGQAAILMVSAIGVLSGD